MPQLDKFIFSSQFFWLFFLLLLSYFLLVRYSLPALLQTLKFRKLKLGGVAVAADSLLLLLSSRSGWVEMEGGKGFLLPASTLFEGSFLQLRAGEQEMGYGSLKLVVGSATPPPLSTPSIFRLKGVDLNTIKLTPFSVAEIQNRFLHLLSRLITSGLSPSTAAGSLLLTSSVVAPWFSYPVVELSSRGGSVNLSSFLPFTISGGVESGFFLLLLHKYSVDLYTQLQFAIPTTPSLFRLERVVVSPVELATEGFRRMGA